MENWPVPKCDYQVPSGKGNSVCINFLYLHTWGTMEYYGIYFVFSDSSKIKVHVTNGDIKMKKVLNKIKKTKNKNLIFEANNISLTGNDNIWQLLGKETKIYVFYMLKL